MTEDVICWCDEHNGHGNKMGMKNLKLSSPGFEPVPVDKNTVKLCFNVLYVTVYTIEKKPDIVVTTKVDAVK